MSKPFITKKQIIFNPKLKKSFSFYNENQDSKRDVLKKETWKFISNPGYFNNNKTSSKNFFHNSSDSLLPNQNNSSFKTFYKSPANSSIYNSIKFNKAPTLKQNQNEIYKLIQKKKIKKKNEFDHLYNNFLINESRNFRTTFYENSRNNNCMKIPRNNSCDDLKMKQISTNSISQDKNSTNYRTFFNLHSTKNSFYPKTKTPSDLNSKNKNFNETFNYINEFNFYSNKFKLPDLQQQNLKYVAKNIPECTVSSVNLMRFQLNDAIFSNIKTGRGFSELQKNLLKFKFYQSLQSEKIQLITKDENYNLDKKYENLTKIKNLYDKKWIIYNKNMENYLNFLIHKIKEIKINIQSDDIVVNEKNNEIEKIVVKVVSVQKELENLVEMRNFLLQVKERYNKNPPNYYYLLLKDSKKLLIGNFLLNLHLSKQITHKKALLFITNVLNIKKELGSQENENEVFCFNFIKSNKILRKSIGMCPKVDPIFSSVDEFLLIYENMEVKTINMIRKENAIKNIINKFKLEYNKLIPNENDNYIKEEIEVKSIKREKLLERNILLNQQFDYYYTEIKKKSNEIKSDDNLLNFCNDKKSKEKKFLFSSASLVDLNKRKIDKYNEKLKKCKYAGVLLLDKLIHVVNKFINANYKDYIEKNGNRFLPYDKLKILLKMNAFKLTEENNKYINNYVIKLIAIYDDICKYILNLHHEYLSDPKKKKFIKIEEGKILEIKKRENAKETKKLLELRSIENVKAILEKYKKPIKYINRKIFDASKMNKARTAKALSERKIRKKDKDFFKEFWNYTQYEDNY